MVYLLRWLFNYFENATDELVEHFYYYYYEVYQNSKDAAHLGTYFDLKVEKHLYISGSRRHQHEIVDFLDTYWIWKLVYKFIQKKILQFRQKTINKT